MDHPSMIAARFAMETSTFHARLIVLTGFAVSFLLSWFIFLHFFIYLKILKKISFCWSSSSFFCCWCVFIVLMDLLKYNFYWGRICCITFDYWLVIVKGCCFCSGFYEFCTYMNWVILFCIIDWRWFMFWVLLYFRRVDW